MSVAKEAEPAQRFLIGDRWVGMGEPVYFIAEAGVNHNGDLARARRMIEVAHESGADAVKFQTFKTEAITTPTAPKAEYHIRTTGTDEEGSWFALLKSQELDAAAHRELVGYAQKTGVELLSTPYDEESIDLLDSLEIAAFKIASTDLDNHALLRSVAAKGRPVILSTGMSDLQEVRESLAVLLSEGQTEVVVLQCTSHYPTPLAESHVRAMVTLREELGVLVGFSDHTLEEINPVLAVGLGAVVFEKHFTLDRSLPGPDHETSLTPDELDRTVQLVRQACVALGDPTKRVLPSERANRDRLRKSIVPRWDLPAGTRLESAMLTAKRPGSGVPPSAMAQVEGRIVRRSLKADELLSMDDLE